MEEQTATFSPSTSLEFRFARGTLINQRYRIDAEIGRGGCGTVFKAFDTLLNTTLALKFLNPAVIADKKKFHRVTREINLLRKVADERIIKIYSLEKWQNYYFLAMEFIVGKSLKQILTEKTQFRWQEFQPLYIEILEGIRVLHGHNIIHRDLKPSNILITEDNKAIIIDFGLAKELADKEKTSSLGEIVGSPFYMSPEQAIIGEEADIRSDIYSLGMILYRALAGEHPFADRPTMEVIYKQVFTKPPKIALKHRKIPRYLRYTLEKALEKKQSRRFQSIDAMLHILKKRKTGIFHYLAGYFLFKPARLVWTGIIIALLAVLMFTLTTAVQDIHSLEKKGSILLARNRLNNRLWKQDFTPYIIKEVYRDTVKVPSVALVPSAETKTGIYPHAVIVFLEHPRNRVFSPSVSLQSLELDNRIVYLDDRGTEIFNRSIIETTGMQTDDFARISEIETIQKKDIDSDGKDELILIIRHSRGMYPSAMCILDQGNFYTLLNPGAVDYYSALPGDGKNIRLVVLGFKNTLSHLAFFAELSLPKDQRFTIREFPSTQHINFNWGKGIEFLALLPRGSTLVSSYKNTWQELGVIAFVDYRSQKQFYLYRDCSLSLDGKSYKENPESLEKIYTSINRCFQARDIEHNLEKAFSLIENSLNHPVINPYLKSALLYLQGDLEVSLGRYPAGEKTLRQALKHHPGNADAAHRICEIYFLKGDIQTAIDLSAGEFSNLKNFWGLGRGNLLFKSYCFLHGGNFAEAEALFPQIVDKSDRRSLRCFQGIADIFKGNYETAVSNLRVFEQEFVYVLSIPELRLLISRARILADRELEQTRFYLEDIMASSFSRRHLAEVSLAYLFARKGNLLEAEKMAAAGFRKVMKLAESDFETRLWLFYDTYIYGMTMEICGRDDEARRGYRESIRANPNSHAARASREYLNNNPRN